MREIKFRAWSKEKNAFIAGFNMVGFHSYYNKGIEPTIEPTVYRYGTKWKLSEIILMQYTELNDKDGGEVYEGDIITFNFRTTKANPNFRGKIFFDQYMWCVETTEGEVFSINRINSVEVIGNIYQNSELYKENETKV